MELLVELLDVLDELAEELDESKRVYARSGNKIVRKIRCAAGPRKGRTVSKASDCFKKKDRKRSRMAKRSARRTKFVRARKSKITKRRSVSKRLRRLNKR